MHLKVVDASLTHGSKFLGKFDRDQTTVTSHPFKLWWKGPRNPFNAVDSGEQWKRAPGCLGYKGDYTTKLYGDYNKQF